MKSLKFIFICALTALITSSCCPSLASYKKQIKDLDTKNATMQKDNDTLRGKLLKCGQGTGIETTINKFLDIQDVSIFNSAFQSFNEREIPLRSRNYYLLIEKIHLLDNLLSDIEAKLSNSRIEKFAKDNAISKEDAQKFLQESAKTDVRNAERMIIEIEKMDKSGLSPQQQKYYRPALIDKYNSYVDTFF